LVCGWARGCFGAGRFDPSGTVTGVVPIGDDLLATFRRISSILSGDVRRRRPFRTIIVLGTRVVFDGRLLPGDEVVIVDNLEPDKVRFVFDGAVTKRRSYLLTVVPD
jgi:hypothetical protein